MIHADIVGERARLTPGKTALVCVADGSRYSYGEGTSTGASKGSSAPGLGRAA